MEVFGCALKFDETLVTQLVQRSTRNATSALTPFLQSRLTRRSTTNGRPRLTLSWQHGTFRSVVHTIRENASSSITAVTMTFSSATITEAVIVARVGDAPRTSWP